MYRQYRREAKRPKGLWYVIKKTYEDFSANTSIHGLKYTSQKDVGYPERIFWVCVTILGLCGAAYMTVLFWGRYMSNPTRTTIKTNYAPTCTISFPAITICNLNKIMSSKVEAFISKLDLGGESEEVVRRALSQLLAFTEPTNVPYNIDEFSILQNVLKRSNFTDHYLIMKSVTQSCEELIVKCRWEFELYDCKELFTESFTLEGLCCSFNYVYGYYPHPNYTMFNGPFTGLQVLLNTVPRKDLYFFQPTQGVKIFIHTPTDYPGMVSNSKVISSGMQCFLQIMASQLECSENVKQLSIDQRQCLYPNERTLHFSKRYEYEDSNCLTECKVMKYYESCRCLPYYFPFVDGPLICNISKFPCLFQTRREQLNTTTCDCPPECDDEFYEVLSTSVFMDIKEHNINSFFSGISVTNETIFLNAYFMGLQTVFFRDTITSTIYLLSSFGGVYSLFIGCSFLTIVELIYYCFLRFPINLGLFGRVGNIEHREKPKINYYKQDKLHFRRK